MENLKNSPKDHFKNITILSNRIKKKKRQKEEKEKRNYDKFYIFFKNRLVINYFSLEI